MARTATILLAWATCCPIVLLGQIAPNSIITTFAGAAYTFPGDGGPALNAPISQVLSLATDLNGNIIFADPGNQVVNRLNSDGTLSVIAGNGVRGFSGDGGSARSASLNNPVDAVMDNNGSLYISDSFNNRIRKVTPDGTISTLYVNASSGARFAIDRNSNTLYTTGPNICVIYRTTSDGVLSIFAGNRVCGHSGDGGPALQASISPNGGLAVDAAGNLYVAEEATYTIRKITPDGTTITTIAGTGQKGFSGDGGPALSATFNFPQSLAIDANGNLLVSDASNEVVRQIDPNGTITTIVGTPSILGGFSGDGGPATTAHLFFPSGLALDSAGNLYISEGGNFRIRSVQAGVINTVAGNGQFRVVPDGTPATQAFIFGPDGITFDTAGNLYVAEVAASKVARIAPDGEFSVLAGTGAAGEGPIGGPAKNALLSTPRALVADIQGNLYFSDNLANVVYAITTDGTLVVVAGQIFNPGYSGDNGSSLKATLRAPFGIAFDWSGNLMIADKDSNVIRRVAGDLTITTFAGTGVRGFSGDNGPATSATLSGPQGIAVDANGDLLICDRFNNRIRMVTPDGAITTIAGDGRALTTGDGGPATQASLNGPFNLTLDGAGNIYILEASGAVLRRIDTSGKISTIAGTPSVLLNGLDGVPANHASLDVGGLAFDSSGNLYLASFDDDKIRVILAAQPTFTTSPTSLEFSGFSGGAPSDAQTVAVSSSYPGIFINITPDSPWLKVTVQNNSGFGFTPASLQLVADPKGLSPGTYRGSVSLSTFGTATPFATISATFTVAPAVPAKLASQPGSLHVSVTQRGALQTQSFQVSNAGTGSLSFSVSATGAAAATISFSLRAGTVQAGSPVNVVATIDPGSLAAGTFIATIVVTSATTGDTANIPVTISVAPRPQRLALSQRGFLFTAVQGGGVSPPQSFVVLNIGDGSFNWSATAITLPLGGPNWLNVTANSGASGAGSATGVVTVSVDPSQLSSAGIYYGLVRIASPGTTNAPQDVEVVLNLLSSANSPGALLSPAGLVFTSFASANPSSQTFTITNLNASLTQFRITAATLDGNAWLQAVPNTTAAPISPGGSQLITVQPDVTGSGLVPGVYYGTLVVQFAGFHRDVAVLLVVAPGASSTGPGSQAAASCTPSRLLPVFTSFFQDFTVPAAWPIPLEVRVVDDCGAPLTSGRVAVNFSNGDPTLALNSLNDGRWQGTWFGSNTRAAQLTVNIVADMDSPKLHGTAPYTGTLQQNDQVPAITAGAVANEGLAPPQAPIPPGAIISVSGKSFSFSSTSANRLPLGVDLSGTEVLLAGRTLPLIYSSAGLIRAVVPYDIDIDSQYSLLVSRDNAISGPQTVAIAGAQPSMFLVDASGDPNTPNKLWAQLTAGMPIDPSLITPGGPVKAGDKLVIYCTGLGAVDSSLDVSSPAPSNPPSLKNPVTVTIGGVTAPVSFAGLVTGMTGVYQVQITVPSGIPAGDRMPLVVSTLGQSSLPVNLSVR
jgi:trimeric autotransporter adhesin